MVTKTMELKDVILSTLAEMDSVTQEESDVVKVQQESKADERDFTEEESLDEDSFSSPVDEERRYLENIRERLLVLFEGFQSPNNTQIEAKVDLTLNFLEYLLATIDTRLDKIK